MIFFLEIFFQDGQKKKSFEKIERDGQKILKKKIFWKKNESTVKIFFQSVQKKKNRLIDRRRDDGEQSGDFNTTDVFFFYKGKVY